MRRPRSTSVLRARSLLVSLCLRRCVPAAASLNGDFGRVRPELTSDNMHDWVGRDAVAGIGGPAVRIPYHRRRAGIARSRLCADRAAVQPQRWDSVLREYGLGRGRRASRDSTAPPICASFTRSIAGRKLRPMRRSSPMRATTWSGSSRSSPLHRACSTWTAGACKACRIVSDVSAGEQSMRVNRMQENKAVIDWVCRAVKARSSLSLRARAAGGRGASGGRGRGRPHDRSVAAATGRLVWRRRDGGDGAGIAGRQRSHLLSRGITAIPRSPLRCDRVLRCFEEDRQRRQL